MAHFAEIVASRVVQVIVAEQDFINTLPGQWVQTSYNTRAGTHYGQNGAPDNGLPLRMNYAKKGDIYDEVLDAFYGVQPSSRSYLDHNTCTWVVALANTYPKVRPPKKAERKTVYINANSKSLISIETWDSIENSIGIKFTSDLRDADYAMPLSDLQTHELVSSAPPEGRYKPSISPQALFNITDRMAMRDLLIPTLKTVQLSNSALPELRAEFKDSPVFVKKRTTYSKVTKGFSYTRWDNVDQLALALEGLELENGLVVQEFLPHPLETLNLHLSINSLREVLVWAAMIRTHESINVLGRYIPWSGNREALTAILGEIARTQDLGPSLHEVELVWLNEQWTLLDWNPRMTGPFIHSLASVYPVVNDALLHMTGSPVQGKAEGLYTEQRTYALTGFDASARIRANRLGLFSFVDNSLTVRLSSVGETSTQVIGRFLEFEDQLASNEKN